MPGVYISRRGHVGVGFGCFGFLIYAFFVMIAVVLIAAVAAIPLAIVLVCLLVLLADATLKLIPSYRRHRAATPLKGPQQTMVGCWTFIVGLIPGAKKTRRASGAKPMALAEAVRHELVKAQWTDVETISGSNVFAGTDREGRRSLVFVYAKGTPSTQVPLDFVRTAAAAFDKMRFQRAVLVSRSKYGVQSIALANKAHLELAHPDHHF